MCKTILPPEMGLKRWRRGRNLWKNSDIKDDEEEIQLKGIFFRAKLLQVLLARNFCHWINVMPLQLLKDVFTLSKT